MDGDARVDLTFQEADVNDLLKSMVLEDFGGGRVAAVSYDSREPRAYPASFSINLNGETTFASILQQARGERVEVTTAPTARTCRASSPAPSWASRRRPRRVARTSRRCRCRWRWRC